MTNDESKTKEFEFFLPEYDGVGRLQIYSDGHK